MTVCSNHPDPETRKLANQLLRDAGYEVLDPFEILSELDIFNLKAINHYRRQYRAWQIAAALSLLTLFLMTAGLFTLIEH